MGRGRFGLGALALCLAACGGGGGGDSGGNGGGGMPPAVEADRVAVAASLVTPTVGSGGIAAFVIVLSNPSGQTATHVQASLSLGAGLSSGGAVTCTATGGALCPADPAPLAVASLPALSTLRFVVPALIAAGSRGDIVSSVTVSADNELAGSNNTAQATVHAYTTDVRVSGAAGADRVTSGGPAVFTMGVGNAGPDAALDLVLQQVVSAGHAIHSMACTATGGATCPVVGAVMTVPSLPSGGSLVFTVTTDVAQNALGPISSTLYASLAGDPVTADNVATVSTLAVLPAGGTTLVAVQSDPGDYIGAGGSYLYSLATARMTLQANGNRVDLHLAGDESWDATFQLPSSVLQLQPGTYANLQRYPFHDPAVGGLTWFGEGRGCNTSRGTIWIDTAVYANGVLQLLDLRFEQHCEGQAPALRGQIHWDLADTTVPPGPVNPPPPTLWRPPAGATPATGNYVYLSSQVGDFVGAGMTATYTQANAVMTISTAGNRLGVSIDGNEGWAGDFQAMSTLAALQPGYYGDLRRYPFHNPAKGGLDWYGESRGCNQLTGWFVIDSITFSGSALASVDLRFEQHCEGNAAALRGAIHWVAGDTTAPPGPQVPPPAGLWTPPAGATPASGNYVYLQSEAGDFVGAGQTYLYRSPADMISIVEGNGLVTVQVNDFGTWSGHFQSMNSINRLAPGYYGNLQRWPFHNPATGGLDWSGMGRGCNQLGGWFVVDSVSYNGTSIASLDLRFEQHCEGMAPALRGKIHWISGG